MQKSAPMFPALLQSNGKLRLRRQQELHKYVVAKAVISLLGKIERAAYDILSLSHFVSLRGLQNQRRAFSSIDLQWLRILLSSKLLRPWRLPAKFKKGFFHHVWTRRSKPRGKQRWSIRNSKAVLKLLITWLKGLKRKRKIIRWR